MARTPSSSLTAKLCLTAGSSSNTAARADGAVATYTPKTVLTLAIITILQTAALIALALNSDSATHIAAAFAMSATACFGLAPFVSQRHTALKRRNQAQQITRHNIEPSNPTDEYEANGTKQSQACSHPPRRNKPPTFATVTPEIPAAAPNAALPANLSPADHAWADLMARISHDLRTPLNAVIGFSELLQQEAFGPLGSPRYQEYARHIHDCGAALLKTAEDTLAMTSALTPDTQEATADATPILLHQVALEAASVLSERAAARDVTIQVKIPAELEVHGEKLALRQILLNLMCEAVSNAQPGTEVIATAVPDDHHHATLEVFSLSCREGARMDTLPMCVARSLLHFSGAELVVTCSQNSGWRAQTRIEYAKQSDFFRQTETHQTATLPIVDATQALATS